MKQKNTINDIAREVGVSKATISHYLNGKFESMSAETQERIRNVILEMEYFPDSRARGLKLKTSNTVGIIVNHFQHQLTTQLVRGINEVCNENGLGTMIYSHGNDIRREIEQIRRCQSYGVDVIALVPANIDCKFYNEVYASGTPILMCFRYRKDWNYGGIYINHVALLYKGLNKLIENNYTNIAFVCEKSTKLSHNNNREEAFIKFMAERMGIDAKNLIFSIDDDRSDEVEYIIHQLVDRFPKGTRAVFANSTSTLYQLLSEIKREGLRIPEDLAVCGYDLLGWSEIVEPGITSLVQPGYRAGLVVGRQLSRYAEDINYDLTGELWLDGKITFRKSTERA